MLQLNPEDEEGHSAAAALLFAACDPCVSVRIECYIPSMSRKGCTLLCSSDVIFVVNVV